MVDDYSDPQLAELKFLVVNIVDEHSNSVVTFICTQQAYSSKLRYVPL